MAANKSKPKGTKLSTSANNLLASFPWLKNKTFLIPALASVLAVSVVGAVLAVQVPNPNDANQGSSDISPDDSPAEVITGPVIGPACVEGEPVCEDVKLVLLEAIWESGKQPYTYESLIEYLVDTYDVTVEFATAVVDAVEYDWGETTLAGPGKTPSPGESLTSPGQSAGGTGCIPGTKICEAARYMTVLSSVPIESRWPRSKVIDELVREFKVTRAEAEAVVDDLNYDWAYQESVSSRNQNSTSETAASAAKRLSSGSSSRAELLSFMQRSYSYSESVAAIDALGIRWADKAATRAQELIRINNGISRAGVISSLVDYALFLESEASAGVDSLGVDWNQEASKAALSYLTSGNVNFDYEPGTDWFNGDPNEYLKFALMQWSGFTEGQATFGVNAYWNPDTQTWNK